MTEALPTGARRQLRSGADAAAAYRTVQRRVDALVRGRTDVCERNVPACPEWSVRQTVSHLAGTAQDMVSLNLDTAGTMSGPRPSWIVLPTTASTRCSICGRGPPSQSPNSWRKARNLLAAKQFSMPSLMNTISAARSANPVLGQRIRRLRWPPDS
ncbi:MAG TPA: maleylpyruvate isomerase N-terminal domain-containing protein [Mycobacterium sp.]|nr:maleylpyruvate isomerase N-terminal domain-containing protein [Mycobacterium sp.]